MLLWGWVLEQISERPLPPRRPRSYPRKVKRARHNSYPVKHQGDEGVRHERAPQPVLIPAA
ncbi:hypothetical protein BQ8420_14845 [Nocardiopsis sp. JB363]|nr:hypothetical protein BQ8420_14845 [Nocardiopsis sp. JB363]